MIFDEEKVQAFINENPALVDTRSRVVDNLRENHDKIMSTGPELALHIRRILAEKYGQETTPDEVKRLISLAQGLIYRLKMDETEDLY